MSIGEGHLAARPSSSPPLLAKRPLELRYRSVGAFLIAYSVRLSKGEIFVETARPLELGVNTTLRLQVPGAPALEVEGRVSWARPTALGPGQPVGMGIALTSSIEEHGAVIDQLAARFARIRVLVVSAKGTARAAIGRYLQSILSCDIVGGNLGPEPSSLEGGIDLAVIDLDSERDVGELIVQTLRCRPDTHDIPIIALAQLERDRARAALLGVDEVLTTPPLFTELRGTVIHALSRASLWVAG